MQLQDYQKAWMRQRITNYIGEMIAGARQRDLPPQTLLQIFVAILNVNDPYPQAEVEVPKKWFFILQHRLWGILHADLPSLEVCYIINNPRDPIKMSETQFQELVPEILQTARDFFWQILEKQNAPLKQELAQYLTQLQPLILANLSLLLPPGTQVHLQSNRPMSPQPT